MLKLTGTGDKASGTVELFPLNGESLSCGAVQVHGMVMETGTCALMLIFGDMSVIKCCSVFLLIFLNIFLL